MAAGGQMYKTILLAYDGSMEGALALREGALLAKTCGARVTLVSVVSDGAAAIGLAEGVGDAVGQEIDAHKSLLKQAITWLRAHGIDPETRLVVGEPAPRIGEVAKAVSADLVVVGHRHQSAFSRWWSGSTQSALSDYVSCSILVACNPTDDDAFDAAQAGTVPA